MSRYFNRQWSLSVDDQEFIRATPDRQFRVIFNIVHEFGGAVNYADIAIYNLADSTAQKVFKKGAKISFSAGYEGVFGQIFAGRVINVLKEPSRADRITRLICRGGYQPRDKVVSSTLGKDSSLVDIIKQIGVATGYSVIMNEKDFAGEPAYRRGYTLSGEPLSYLGRLSQTHGFSYIVDGDNIIISAKDKFIYGEPIVVNEFSGMQGVPEITETGCDVKVRLNHAFRLGGRIDIKSDFSTFNFGNLYYQDIPPSAGSGIYRMFKISHAGDNFGGEWTTTITGFR